MDRLFRHVRQAVRTNRGKSFDIAGELCYNHMVVKGRTPPMEGGEADGEKAARYILCLVILLLLLAVNAVKVK